MSSENLTCIYSGSSPATFCYSYPGINLALQQTTLEQPVVLARGATGCLDTPCNIMRYIALVLGKRNEHQRGDRDSWIIVQPDSSLAVPVSLDSVAFVRSCGVYIFCIFRRELTASTPLLKRTGHFFLTTIVPSRTTFQQNTPTLEFRRSPSLPTNHPVLFPSCVS